MDKSAKDPAKIQNMFSTIAHRYDLLNRVLSLGIDRRWRKFAVNQLPKVENGKFLDVATGTCDVALDIIKRHSPGTKVVGLDILLVEAEKYVVSGTMPDSIQAIMYTSEVPP